MQIMKLTQGTPEWHAYRAQKFNASDAPVMLGCSASKTRSQLVKELATGVSSEVSAFVQKRVLDEGHRVEAAAREVADEIVCDNLAPIVGCNGQYSASFDGLTFDRQIGWECKSFNDALRVAFAEMSCPDAGGVYPDGWLLPKPYRVQMEQQIMVSGCEQILFTAGKLGTGGIVEVAHCWYRSDSNLRAEIVAGWELLAADVAAYKAQGEVPVVVGTRRDGLPMLNVRAVGEIQASNLNDFLDYAKREIDAISTTPADDQEFADAELDVRWCAEGEKAVAEAKRLILTQTGSVQDALAKLDEMGGAFRAKRLTLEKVVKSEKESLKAELIASTLVDLQAELGEQPAGWLSTQLSIARARFGAAIKGKRTLLSVRDALRAELAGVLADAKNAPMPEGSPESEQTELVSPLPEGEKVKLGEINTILAKAGIQTSAAGLAELGLEITKEKGAVLIDAGMLPEVYLRIAMRMQALFHKATGPVDA